jgi:ABC-type uncharacterized transport system substrate-binding protein
MAAKRNLFGIVICVLIATFCSPAESQQPQSFPRVGFIANSPGPLIEAFQRGLRELAYIEGKNIVIEYRYIEGDRNRIPKLVTELVNLKVDILIAVSPPSIRAATLATQTIPIVVLTPQDPVATGTVVSLAHPGRNVTGLTSLTRELSAKTLQLLKEAVPGTSRVGVLSVTEPGAKNHALREYKAAANLLGIQIQSLEVRGPKPDLDSRFRDAIKERVNAVLAPRNNVLASFTRRIAELAITYRLPSVLERSEYADAGGLMSYGADDADLYRRIATYTDKILKGANPADLPVERPTKFELVINVKTAKQIGLNIPPNVLARADRVIK